MVEPMSEPISEALKASLMPQNASRRAEMLKAIPTVVVSRKTREACKSGGKTALKSAIKAVRAYCLSCGEGNTADTRRCPITDCPLYPWRPPFRTKGRGARLKAIRAFCLRCMGGSKKAVAECLRTDCPLFGFRFGRKARPDELLVETRGPEYPPRKEGFPVRLRQPRRCQACGSPSKYCSWHHIKPRSEGGSDHFSNLIYLCPECHDRAEEEHLNREQILAMYDRNDLGEPILIAAPGDHWHKWVYGGYKNPIYGYPPPPMRSPDELAHLVVQRGTTQ